MEGYSMLNRSIGQKITEIRLIHEEIYTMSEPYFRSFPKSMGDVTNVILSDSGCQSKSPVKTRPAMSKKW